MYMCMYHLQKYQLMQKSTLSVVVQYHLKISVLQHCYALSKGKSFSKPEMGVCKKSQHNAMFKPVAIFRNNNYVLNYLIRHAKFLRVLPKLHVIQFYPMN